jgi:predicted ATPase with chaperone activity
MDSIQEKALKMALSGHNLLITGYPGTGKSFTVARIKLLMPNFGLK